MKIFLYFFSAAPKRPNSPIIYNLFIFGGIERIWMKFAVKTSKKDSKTEKMRIFAVFPKKTVGFS